MGDSQTSTDVQTPTASTSVTGSAQTKLFAPPSPEPSNLGKIIGLAVAALVLGVGGMFFFRESKAKPQGPQNIVLSSDSYASNLVFTQLAMSESTSLSGGKSTFIDGHVKNVGPETLTSVTMQVLFRNDAGLSPQAEIVPLALIRTHEPYVDTESVSSAPLKPGDDMEFRLIFERVNENWNQQMPELLVIRVSRR